MGRCFIQSRDWSGYLVDEGGDHLNRYVDDAQHQILKEFSNSKCMDDLVSGGQMVPFEFHERQANISLTHPWKYRVKRINGISVPQEWSFRQLQDTALNLLDVQTKILLDGFTLKDGTAFNSTLSKNRPVFFDFGSIGRISQHSPWLFVDEFLRHFLLPLALSSVNGIETRKLLFGNIDGVSYEFFFNTLPKRKLLSSKLMSRLYLSHMIQQSLDLKSLSKLTPHINTKTITRILWQFKHSIANLRPDALPRYWQTYTSSRDHYTSSQIDQRASFVKDGLKYAESTVLDIGTNTGSESLAAARNYPNLTFIAIDNDSRCIDTLYEHLKGEPLDNVSPLVMDFSNPTPNFGWVNLGVKSFFERFSPDFIMALAVVHHIVIKKKIRFDAIVRELARAKFFLIEVPTQTDSKLLEMLNFSPDREYLFQEFAMNNIVSGLERYATVLSHLELGTRYLFLCKSRFSNSPAS